MQRIVKIAILFIFMISIYGTIVRAETTNLYNDVENENTTNTSQEDNNVNGNETENETNTSPFENDLSEENEDITNTSATASTTSMLNSNARINTVSSIPEANLGLNNVLCIILIALGVLIVLLAIAILIRLKK